MIVLRPPFSWTAGLAKIITGIPTAVSAKRVHQPQMNITVPFAANLTLCMMPLLSLAAHVKVYPILRAPSCVLSIISTACSINACRADRK